MKKIILTGGGTAGHVTPALALLPELKKNGFEATFIGGDGIEKELAAKYGVPYYRTSTVKLDRSNPLKNLKIPYFLHKGVSEATDILEKIKPDIIFSKGGYASLPTCFAAKKLRIPIVVHESDYSLGVANKAVSKFAKITVTSFPETKGGICLGNPVRREITEGNRQNARSAYNVDPAKNTILIFGGSLGAEKINATVYSALAALTENFNVIHISGKCGDFSIKHKDYIQIKFTDDMGNLYALCDVAVARGGANSLAELAATGKRAVIIPLPKGNSRGDQVENALSYRKRGFFEILPQDKLNADTLIAAINTAFKKPVPRGLCTDADKKIVEKIVEIVDKG